MNRSKEFRQRINTRQAQSELTNARLLSMSLERQRISRPSWFKDVLLVLTALALSFAIYSAPWSMIK